MNDGQKKKKWRVGDKVKFRCKYRNDEWTAVDIEILQQAPLFSSLSFAQQQRQKQSGVVLHLYIRRRIGDIKATATVKNKQEKAFQILNWLEHPLEEKVDWSNFEDMNVSDLVNQYKDEHSHSSHETESNNKLQRLKTQITLEAMKCVVSECMNEECGVPQALTERIIRNLKFSSELPSIAGSNSSNISDAIALLKVFIDKYHHTNEKDDLTDLQRELKQIEILPQLIEQKTLDNTYWIVSKHIENSRRLRIYLYCPECTELKPDRVRTDKRYPLKLAKEDIPWLYWSDFQVAPNFQLLCSIFDIERKVAIATIPASGQIIIVEEQSLRSKSNQTRVAILGHMTGTSTTNIKHVEIFRHLIREIEDETSFCFAVNLVKELKAQIGPSQSDISDASTDIISKLDKFDATLKQVYQALFVCTLWKEWDMRQYLSAKQFFVIINALVKEESSKQPHLSVIQTLTHNFTAFEANNASILRDSISNISCASFEKLMLIPCFNYLALSKWATQQEEFLHFSETLRNIDFEIDNSRIDEKVLAEILILDLRLRKNVKLLPKISIVNNFISVLQYHRHHIEYLVQLSINNTHEKIESQGFALILQLIWTKGEEDEKINEKQALTNIIFRLFLKNTSNHTRWIELLADSSTISDHKLFSRALRDSFKEWLQNKEEEEKDTSGKVLFHSKVIELVSSDSFAKAKLYHPDLIESVNERHDELSMNNKKWNSKEIEIYSKVKWELWSQILNHIDNIPKIEDVDEKNVESASKKLCSSLGHCFECESWFKQESSMQTKLFTFFNQVLTQLITKNKLLPVYVYQYLVQHWKAIENITSHCPMNVKSSLQQLEKIVDEYRQFFELIQMFRRIHSDYLLEHDLSGRLKEFRQQSDTWETQGFVSVKENYKDEIQLLKSYEQKMKITLERSQSLMFNKIWEKYNSQCTSIRDQKPLFIFDKVFNDMGHILEDFKQVHNRFFLLKRKERKLHFSIYFVFLCQLIDLEWVFVKNANDSKKIKKCLIDEMKHLFPEYKDEQRQEIANDVEQKFKKEIDLKEQLQSWIELRKVTEKIKEYHPCKDKIREDEKWKEYVKALARMEEITRTNEDISIEQTSQCYDACIECVGEGAKPCVDIGLFDVLNRCEDQLKILVQNQNFNDEAHFENTLNVLSKSKHQAIQDLVTSLRHVNSIMQETLWKCPLEDTTSLAKAILKLHSNDQEFVKMISKCCDMDLNNISIMVNEADKIRTEKSLKQLKDAMAFGEWQFASCEDALQGKKEKELFLKMADTTWNCEEIGENIDRVLLGVDKQELKKIESIIQQFEECKEISSYRIEFWKKGGRIDIEDDEKGGIQNGSLKLSVRSQKDEFENCKELWKRRLMEWKKQCFKLREKFPALNYFCFNQVHFLIQTMDQLTVPNFRDHAIQASKYIKPFLQKINCHVTDYNVNNILKDWIGFNFKDLEQHDANDNDSNFRTCRDSIAKQTQFDN
ncbi:hypothetical protein RFI_12543 [Reticulomyxa filosa]|uniref:Viral A-type inclusion protein n=1 Tax=Reticulomyxa filosa TaxID=46433 RepID=X6NGX9_RETFI|nr:hypothetical protein RFI_12543 [Reticulomyxa filosa]|eukprot:ETO24617.1 hypothetical protein RFI_12543 [Reticulomyxa filosa]